MHATAATIDVRQLHAAPGPSRGPPGSLKQQAQPTDHPSPRVMSQSHPLIVTNDDSVVSSSAAAQKPSSPYDWANSG